VAASAAAIVRVLARTPEGARVSFDLAGLGDLALAIDAEDLKELLGNLLDNAARNARGMVRIVRIEEPGRRGFAVEDDGAGLPAGAQTVVAGRGVRLDSSGGAGLGLAIVDDIVTANGGELRLGQSDLGGLAAAVTLPA